MPFNDFFSRLFSFGKAGYTCHEIQRSQAFGTAYKKWLAEKVYLNWTGPFYKAYHFKKSNIPSSDYRVQLIEETNVHGVILFYATSIGQQNFTFLFEYFKDSVAALGYNIHNADVRHVKHERYKEKIERYALTPPASDLAGTDLCNQLYGNIHVDLVSVNKHAGYIRFVANSYTDPYFSEPLPFMELLQKILHTDTATGLQA